MATQVGFFHGGKDAKQDEADVERGVEKFANEEDKKTPERWHFRSHEQEDKGRPESER